MARSFHSSPRAQSGKFHQVRRSAITGGARRRMRMTLRVLDPGMSE